MIHIKSSIKKLQNIEGFMVQCINKGQVSIERGAIRSYYNTFGDCKTQFRLSKQGSFTFRYSGTQYSSQFGRNPYAQSCTSKFLTRHCPVFNINLSGKLTKHEYMGIVKKLNSRLKITLTSEFLDEK